MLKFFRKIRQNLLSEGKTGNYLKYAIGEIVLVVIGILIALQINNWNTNKTLSHEELKILTSLTEEFSQNLENFDIAYKKHIIRKKSIELIMSPGIEKAPLDSLALWVRNVGLNFTFNPYQGIYNSVINSGKIELISNDSLKQRISRFQDLLSDYQEEEIYIMRFVENNLYPFIIENRKLNFNKLFAFSERTDEEKRLLKVDLIRMIAAEKYENLLVYMYGYMQDTFVEGPILREEMVSIINFLEAEIQKKK